MKGHVGAPGDSGIDYPIEEGKLDLLVGLRVAVDVREFYKNAVPKHWTVAPRQWALFGGSRWITEYR